MRRSAANPILTRADIPAIDGVVRDPSSVFNAEMLRPELQNLDDFVDACLKSWSLRIPFGVYNITNTGNITTREVVAMIQQTMNLDRKFRFFKNETEFMDSVAQTPRSSCILDNGKLLATGIPMRDLRDAISEALCNWLPDRTSLATCK